MKNKAIYLILSAVFFSNIAFASDITLCGDKTQGSILTGKTSKNIKKLYFNNQEIKLTKDKQFIIAFSRDDKLEHSIVSEDSKGIKTTYPLVINTTKWDIQNISGIEQKKVEPSKEDQTKIQTERTAIRSSQKNISNDLFWQEEFSMPLIGRISGNFGGQRVMNGKKMNPHMGMDIASPHGTEIKSPANGTVTLSGMNDFFYSGNVITIDHGHGLFTIYAHLSKTIVKNGDKIKQGDIIGLVGTTGRSTGPHLHWGASLNGTRFDPKYLLSKNSNCEEL